MMCGCRACDQQHQLSFTGGLWGREPQDYDNDAIAVHMGCFDVPNAPVDDLTGQHRVMLIQHGVFVCLHHGPMLSRNAELRVYTLVDFAMECMHSGFGR